MDKKQELANIKVELDDLRGKINTESEKIRFSDDLWKVL